MEGWSRPRASGSSACSIGLRRRMAQAEALNRRRGEYHQKRQAADGSCDAESHVRLQKGLEPRPQVPMRPSNMARAARIVSGTVAAAGLSCGCVVM